MVLLANGRLFKTHLMIVCKSIFFPFLSLYFQLSCELPEQRRSYRRTTKKDDAQSHLCFNDKLMKNSSVESEILYPRRQRDTMQCNPMVENVHYKQAIRMHFGPKVGQAVDWDSSIVV